MKGRHPTDAATRFWRKVDKSGDCWLWTGALTNGGYGRFPLTQYDGKLAHRWAWEQWNGNIPDGFQLDHLCRVRNCVNPAHLEPVTPGENTRRGRDARMAEQPYCPNGHERSPENTRFTTSGTRECRPCRTEMTKRYRHRIKEDRSSDPTWASGYKAGYEAAMREMQTIEETA